MKRGYLLPEGCKDLIDVLNLPPLSVDRDAGKYLIDVSKLKPEVFKFTPKKPPSHFPAQPPILTEILIPEGISVAQVTALLGQKLFRIIADLMELGVFATANQSVSFEILCKVARKYGFIAKKAP